MLSNLMFLNELELWRRAKLWRVPVACPVFESLSCVFWCEFKLSELRPTPSLIRRHVISREHSKPCDSIFSKAAHFYCIPSTLDSIAAQQESYSGTKKLNSNSWKERTLSLKCTLTVCGDFEIGNNLGLAASLFDPSYEIKLLLPCG